ncbi:anthrone oxygenase family protein [Mycobacterium colombiense]
MTLIHASAWLMVWFAGLFSGGIFFVAVERLNLWRRMPLDQYVVDFRRSLYRLDPLMPILGSLAALAAVVFALDTSSGRAAALAYIGVGLIGLIMVASILVAEPMNSKFRRLAEGEAPDEVERLRASWRRFHLARTAVALAAFGCLVGALA